MRSKRSLLWLCFGEKFENQGCACCSGFGDLCSLGCAHRNTDTNSVKHYKEEAAAPVCKAHFLYSMASGPGRIEFDHLFKLLLVGDSGVGKSSLLLRFTSDTFDDLSPTIGVDFKLKLMTLSGKKLKLTIWDTAGQERFRTLTSSYYRGAQGIILVYDVTRRDTFTNLSDIWLKEVDLHSTNQDCIKMLVGNKVDKDAERVVSKQEGIAFARQYGCLFLECSAKTRVNVEHCFEELVLKILETPSLLNDTSSARKNILRPGQPNETNAESSTCC